MFIYLKLLFQKKKVEIRLLVVKLKHEIKYFMEFFFRNF